MRLTWEAGSKVQESSVADSERRSQRIDRLLGLTVE
jgi:hypothetical protein